MTDVLMPTPESSTRTEVPAYKADGSAGEPCAGWAARRRVLVTKNEGANDDACC